jgi:stage II sporulation protein D
MRLRVILLAAPAVAALAPASAPAATWVVSGAGFGHGVGLSQYGAYGMAQQGAGHRRILRHYYRGTRIGDAGSRTIRVLLRERAPSLTFAGATRIGGKRANRERFHVATRLPGRRVRVRGFGTFPAPLVVSGGADGVRLRGPAMNGVTGGRYRRALEISPYGPRGLAAVNALPLDTYLQGVVAGEMPSSWAIEALKAQAVVARSYALTTDAGGDLFDQYADTRSQMYRGVVGEADRTNRAVRATRGEVVTYDGDVAVTYYHSTSGGRTASVEEGFPGAEPVPYLRSVPDPTDRISPVHRWSARFTQRGIERRLRGIVRGRLRAIRVISRGPAGRVFTARVVGSRGARDVAGTTIRERLGLRSHWFRVTRR